MSKLMYVIFPCACLSAATPSAADRDPLDYLAVAQATSGFMAQRQKCGDKTVMAVDVTPPQMPSAFTTVPGFKQLQLYTIYNEAVDLEWQIEGPGAKLTVADRMNGLQWKGRVHVVSKAAREISVSRGGNGAKGEWTTWKAGVKLAIVSVQQRNGSWETQVQEPDAVQALGHAGRMRKAACAEVPR